MSAAGNAVRRVFGFFAFLGRRTGRTRVFAVLGLIPVALATGKDHREDAIHCLSRVSLRAFYCGRANTVVTRCIPRVLPVFQGRPPFCHSTSTVSTRYPPQRHLRESGTLTGGQTGNGPKRP